MKNKVDKPIIGITMGDPAGIGPEICVGAISDPSVHEISRPLIIGSQKMLKRAAQVLDKHLKFNIISDPKGARFEPGCVDIIQTGDYDEDSLMWGQVQKLPGKMAYDWICKSIDLGLEGRIDGVATSPINKQAIKLAGIQEAGHTEIYQDLTHSPYALTMFSCQKLRVFFLSRHMSLIDACRYPSR